MTGDHQILRGVVQFSLPSLGVVYVRPVDDSPVFDQLYTCYLNTTGGYFGAASFHAPQTGQLVLVYRYTDTGLCYIMANPNAGIGVRNQAFDASHPVYNYPWSVNFNKAQLTERKQEETLDQTLLQDSFEPDTNGAPCDLMAGDLYIGDKNGGGLLISRGQQLLKAGQMCALQLDAVNKKLVQTYVQKEQITLHSYKKDTPNATIELRAASVDQQLGRKGGSTQPVYNLLQQDDDVYIQSREDTASLFRQQKVSGSAYNGSISTIIIPQEDLQLYTNQTKTSCVLMQTRSYSGQYGISAQDMCFVKSAHIKAPQYTQNTDLQISYQASKIKTQAIQQASIDAPLLLQQYIQQQQPVISQEQAKYMLQDGFYTYPTTLQDMLSWNEGQERNAQYLQTPESAVLHNDSSDTQSMVYKNTSFIKQAPDGSIFIKDGWGSQIRMSRGNIIISSALDTFIRPGRDCIELVPRLKQITTNGSAVIASKQSVKIGAQKNVKIASALSGGQGSTVIQNRTKNPVSQNSGVVIRSNADMSVTASKDMYIGLNDKTSKNAQNQTTRSNGTVVFDCGSRLVVNSSKAVQIESQNVSLFGYASGTGSALSVQPGRVSIAAQATDMDSLLRIGQHSNNAQIATLNDRFNVRGASVHGIQLTGFIDCKQLVSRQWITTLGNVIGGTYMTTQPKPQEQIPNLQPYSLRQLNKNYASDLKLQMQRIQNLPFEGISCYTDQFICSKELHFANSQLFGFDTYIMPGMCWQRQSSTLLEPVTQTKTGQDTQTASYPGISAWDGAAYITAVVDGQLKKDILMKQGYYTNVDRTIEED